MHLPGSVSLTRPPDIFSFSQSLYNVQAWKIHAKLPMLNKWQAEETTSCILANMWGDLYQSRIFLTENFCCWAKGKLRFFFPKCFSAPVFPAAVCPSALQQALIRAQRVVPGNRPSLSLLTQLDSTFVWRLACRWLRLDENWFPIVHYIISKNSLRLAFQRLIFWSCQLVLPTN